MTPASRRLRDDRGFGLVEVAVASGVMAVAVTGLVGAMTVTAGVLGASKQRSAASAVASQRIEIARNLPYGQIADDEALAHSSDPTNPDSAVTTDNPVRYTVSTGSTEPLVMDPTSGAIRHVEDPVTLGATELYVYQYVSCPTGVAPCTGPNDYKRVTVVVTWRQNENAGVASRLVASTFIGPGIVVVPQSTPGNAPPAPTPTPTPSPTPTPACFGDSTAPTAAVSTLSSVGAQSGFTNSTTVQVVTNAVDACAQLEAYLSNDASTWTDVADLVSGAPTTVAWGVTSGDGSKTISLKVEDGAGNVSVIATATIILDQTKPTTPANLRASSCVLSGSTRSATLTWDASTDTNLAGYRLYRSVDLLPYTVVATTSSQSATDASSKTSGSVRYIVRAFDKAGNESADSNVKTYAKNSCA